MNKPNYELKAKVISNGMAQKQREISLTFFKQSQQDKILLETGEIIEQWKPLDIKTAQFYLDMFLEEYPEEYQECKRVNKASYQRTKRLKDKIQDMILKGNCIFLTLTFTNDVLDSTNQDTRKRYVKRFLKSVSNQYVANIDYGKKYEREHYHAIVLCDDKIDHNLWKYGNIDFERVRVNEDTSSVKMAKYINKLTNHAIKETVRRNCVIYSR